MPQIMSLAVPVEFPNSRHLRLVRGAGDYQGAAANQIPPPDQRDNNTIWYQDATPALYNEMYFGVGPNAGVIVQHPNLGAVDLRGNTMANYYLEQSEGKFQPKGAIYPTWLQAAHSRAGMEPIASPGTRITPSARPATTTRNVHAADLVRKVVGYCQTLTIPASPGRPMTATATASWTTHCDPCRHGARGRRRRAGRLLLFGPMLRRLTIPRANWPVP